MDVVFLLSYFRCRDAQCTLEDWSSFWAPTETFDSDVMISDNDSDVTNDNEEAGEVFGESPAVYPEAQVRGFMVVVNFAKSL